MTAKKHQTYNDGLCRIYSVKNTNESGRRPSEVLDKELAKLPYEIRTLGIRRMAAMAQMSQKADTVLRVPNIRNAVQITTQHRCIPNDNSIYKIVRLGEVTDSTPPSIDLYLERLDIK